MGLLLVGALISTPARATDTSPYVLLLGVNLPLSEDTELAADFELLDDSEVNMTVYYTSDTDPKPAVAVTVHVQNDSMDWTHTLKRYLFDTRNLTRGNYSLRLTANGSCTLSSYQLTARPLTAPVVDENTTTELDAVCPPCVATQIGSLVVGGVTVATVAVHEIRKRRQEPEPILAG